MIVKLTKKKLNFEYPAGYLAQTRYPAGYPACRISGIQLFGYPVHPYKKHANMTATSAVIYFEVFICIYRYLKQEFFVYSLTSKDYLEYIQSFVIFNTNNIGQIWNAKMNCTNYINECSKIVVEMRLARKNPQMKKRIL